MYPQNMPTALLQADPGAFITIIIVIIIPASHMAMHSIDSIGGAFMSCKSG
jgi:hypothetical protein